MAIKFEKIVAGMTLYDVRKNTGMTSNKWSTWPVQVIEVDEEERRVLASWNCNKAEWMHERQITKFRAKKPANDNKW
jgi:hypothetical protein